MPLTANGTSISGYNATDVVYGSGEGPYGSQSILLDRNISWTFNWNPYDRPMYRGDANTHFVCLSNNATVQETCCESLGGHFVAEGNGGVPVNTSDVVNGWPTTNWCELAPIYDYTRTANTSVNPDEVQKWASCFNATAVPANNPGMFASNVTVDSTVWICELSTNGSSTANWNPLQYGFSTTIGAANRNAASLLGGLWCLAMMVVLS